MKKSKDMCGPKSRMVKKWNKENEDYMRLSSGKKKGKKKTKDIMYG